MHPAVGAGAGQFASLPPVLHGNTMTTKEEEGVSFHKITIYHITPLCCPGSLCAVRLRVVMCTFSCCKILDSKLVILERSKVVLLLGLREF